jgi:hypothetical protein
MIMRAEHGPQQEKSDKPERANEQRHEQATRPDRTGAEGLCWRVGTLPLDDQRVHHATQQPNDKLAAEDSGEPGQLSAHYSRQTGPAVRRTARW